MAKVLLVDDVELFLQLETSFLEDFGHTVVAVSSGEEALQELASSVPDLLLLDLYMPGIDGDEVCRRIRATESINHLPVIMVTSAGRDEEVEKCLHAGCDDYITKPINKQMLHEKIQRLLGQLKGRVAPRSPVQLRVQVRTNGKSLEASARDISRNGIYVRSRTVLAPGSVVNLTLELPGERRLAMLGKVKRVQEGKDKGMGIYFIHPEPEAIVALGQLAVEGAKNVNGGPALCTGQDGFDHLEQQNAEILRENKRLHERIRELEAENREFAEHIVRTEEVNNNLTNLYIASSRLHSTLDRSEVLRSIQEVVINFVGAEKLAILLADKESGQLCFEAGEGFDSKSFPPFYPSNALWKSVVADGESYFVDGPVGEGSEDPCLPVAAIPLKIKGETMGVLAIYQLFTQKSHFDKVDYQLFSMLGEHAATALFSSTIYEVSERKRETYKNFMDLLLS